MIGESDKRVSDNHLHPEFFDLVTNVRAMRRLKPDPVPEELIFKVLNAGVQAASGQNLQPWEFVLVDDPAKKQWFAERYREAMYSRFRISPDKIKEGQDKRARPAQWRLHRFQMGRLTAGEQQVAHGRGR